MLAAAVLLDLPTVSAQTAKTAKTWYLEQGRQWQPLSQENKKAFMKANTLFRKGKLAKAAGSYDKFLQGCDPNSDLYTLALERQFHIARQYLAGRKKRVLGIFSIRGYAEGVAIMDRISERAGNAAIGMDAAVEVARSYEGRGRLDKTYYDMAHLKWSQIFDTYDSQSRLATSRPTGQIRKDALLAMARCKHIGYKGPKYDASGLVGRPFGEHRPYDTAVGCYKEFNSQYEDAEKFGIDKKLEQIREQLAHKDFSTGKYYQKAGNKQAANLYYQMVVRDWPGTKAATMANEMLVKNLSSEETKK
jgi:tetratricopeptide (TPR) repeat protein